MKEVTPFFRFCFMNHPFGKLYFHQQIKQVFSRDNRTRLAIKIQSHLRVVSFELNPPNENRCDLFFNYSLHLSLILEIIFQYKSLNNEITVYCEEKQVEIFFYVKSITKIKACCVYIFSCWRIMVSTVWFLCFTTIFCSLNPIGKLSAQDLRKYFMCRKQVLYVHLV